MTLFELQQKYCNETCPQIANQCPIVHENHDYCPRCDGYVIEHKDLDGKTVPSIWHGGLIVIRTKTKGDYMFSCVCECGQVYKRMKPFDFSNDNYCFFYRTQERLKIIQENIKDRPSLGILTPILDRILGR